LTIQTKCDERRSLALVGAQQSSETDVNSPTFARPAWQDAPVFQGRSCGASCKKEQFCTTNAFFTRCAKIDAEQKSLAANALRSQAKSAQKNAPRKIHFPRAPEASVRSEREQNRRKFTRTAPRGM
jgi:hypothetical protein